MPPHKIIRIEDLNLISIWIGIICVCDLSFAFSFFFFFFGTCFRRQISLLQLLFMNSSHIIWLFNHISAHQWVPCTIHWTHKPYFSAIFLLKMSSHGTIHILKNYFATVFSVFSKNKLYPNGPLINRTSYIIILTFQAWLPVYHIIFKIHEEIFWDIKI